jgi:hypothetical protein
MTPQVPWIDPVVMRHVVPRQQSALIVQLPPSGLQIGPASVVGVMQRSSALASGMQGTPLQQSPANAQVWPAVRHVQLTPPSASSVQNPLQRGTPSASIWQTPELPTAAQQSLRAEEMSHA